MQLIDLQEFTKKADILVDIILSSKKKYTGIKYDGIIVIGRGGMHLGYYLATKLNIRNIQILSIETPHSHGGSDYMVHSQPQIEEGTKYLIVDDLIDSGGTLDFIDKNFNIKGDVAVLFIHKNYELNQNRNIFFTEFYNERLTFYYEL